MKNFWKNTLSIALGSIITIVVIILILIGIISASFSGLSKLNNPQEELFGNAILKIKLETNVPDRANDNPFEDLNMFNSNIKKSLGLNDILKTIEKAKTDPRIKGIFLDLTIIDVNMATLEEIRNKLLEFKETYKFIISYSSSYSQKAYYLATVSDKIYINPQGNFSWKGLSSQVMFFKGLLEKLGVEAQIFRHGEFKSAVEPFMSTEMSPASKKQTNELLQSVWIDICEKISQARNISTEELNTFADNLSVYDAKTALENKFIDDIKYYDEVIDELKILSNLNDNEENLFISISKYSKVKSAVIRDNLSNNEIAVIFAEGDIIDGDKTSNNSSSIAGNYMAKIIREARENKNVKAVVLRVNSPGGSGLASEIIWREVNNTKSEKPVVVSMGNYAASGGYYISCPAHYIFAQPNTLTGSIGVFSMIPNIKKLMNDKLGITFDEVNTNQYSDYFSMTRPANEKEKEYFQRQVEDFYDIFMERVSEGRKMSKEEVDSIGQGRVWSGLNAIKINLVDEIGGLNDAVKKAVDLSNVSDYKIVEYPVRKKNFMSAFLENMSENISAKSLKEILLGENNQVSEAIDKIKQMKGIQARMPYELEID